MFFLDRLFEASLDNRDVIAIQTMLMSLHVAFEYKVYKVKSLQIRSSCHHVFVCFRTSTKLSFFLLGFF